MAGIGLAETYCTGNKTGTLTRPDEMKQASKQARISTLSDFG
jgi:hypothetical protein